MAGYIGTQAVSVNTTSATISDDLAVGDDLTVTDDAAIGGTLAVTGVATFTATPVFSADVTIEDDLFLDSDSATIHFGEDNEVKLFHVADVGLQLTGSGLNSNFTLAAYHTTDGTVPDLKLAKSGSNTIGTNAATADGEALGQIRFAGVDTSGDSREAVTMSVAQVGTASGTVAGDFTLDVAGDINLDADGGDINFKDGGTLFGFMAKSNNDLLLGNAISDGDVLIRGKDGSSNITALTFDMSSTGQATFNSNIIAPSIFLGGETAGANRFDYYEEGTFTPTIFGGSTAGTYEVAAAGCHYTRIGNVVTCMFNIVLASSITAGGSGNMHLSGLPFPYDASLNKGFTGNIRLGGVDFNTNAKDLNLVRQSGSDSTVFVISELLHNATQGVVQAGEFAANDSVRSSITYLTLT